jgi:hypothetical protein
MADRLAVLARDHERRPWTCWCGDEHPEPTDVRCLDCGDFAPGFHWRPVPKPWWWDNEKIRAAAHPARRGEA